MHFQLMICRPPKCRHDICEDVSGDTTFQQTSKDVQQDVLPSVLMRLCKYSVSHVVLLLRHLNSPSGAFQCNHTACFALYENSFSFPEFKSQKLT